MLEIKDLHVNVFGKEILKGLSLKVPPGEVHAIMGPNGAGKSTTSYTLAGRAGYEVTSGEIDLYGEDITGLSPEERAAKGIFLAFQYPMEIPGVSTMNFLKTAMNAQARTRGEKELDAAQFLRIVRAAAKELNISEDMLKRPLNVGFSGGEKKRNETLQMALLKPKLAILDEMDSGLDIDALKLVAEGVNKLRAPDRSFLVITHYQRLLDYIVPGCHPHPVRRQDRDVGRQEPGAATRRKWLRRRHQQGCVRVTWAKSSRSTIFSPAWRRAVTARRPGSVRCSMRAVRNSPAPACPTGAWKPGAIPISPRPCTRRSSSTSGRRAARTDGRLRRGFRRRRAGQFRCPPIAPWAPSLCARCSADKDSIAANLIGKINPQPDHPIINLNTALMEEGLVLHVPKGVTLATPLHLRFNWSGVEAQGADGRHLRILIVLEEGAAGTIFETHDGSPSFATIVTELSLAANAKLTHVRLENFGAAARQTAATVAEIGEGAPLSRLLFLAGRPFRPPRGAAENGRRRRPTPKSTPPIWSPTSAIATTPR